MVTTQDVSIVAAAAVLSEVNNTQEIKRTLWVPLQWPSPLCVCMCCFWDGHVKISSGYVKHLICFVRQPINLHSPYDICILARPLASHGRWYSSCTCNYFSLLRWQGGRVFLMWFMHGCGAGLTSTRMNSSMSNSASMPLTWSMTACVSTHTIMREWCHQALVSCSQWTLYATKSLLKNWKKMLSCCTDAWFYVWYISFKSHLMFFLPVLAVGLSLQNTGEFLYSTIACVPK